MKKNNIILVLFLIIIFLLGSIYYRTGYFRSSISKNKTLFYTKKDTILSESFYFDLSGNVILLDKEKVILKKNIKIIEIPFND